MNEDIMDGKERKIGVLDQIRVLEQEDTNAFLTLTQLLLLNKLYFFKKTWKM